MANLLPEAPIPPTAPLPGHGTNPIAAAPPTSFDGLAAARMTDKSACGSPITGAVSATDFPSKQPYMPYEDVVTTYKKFGGTTK